MLLDQDVDNKHNPLSWTTSRRGYIIVPGTILNPLELDPQLVVGAPELLGNSVGRLLGGTHYLKMVYVGKTNQDVFTLL